MVRLVSRELTKRGGKMKTLLILAFITVSFNVEGSKSPLKRPTKRHLRSPIKKEIIMTPADCGVLEKRFKEKFSPLVAVIKDSPTQQCVYKQKISEENLNFFIRAAFYHKEAAVKKEAFNKLESFTCGFKLSCQEFYKMIDTHDKAAAQSQKKTWQGFAGRANSIKEKALAQLNQL
jgi:hypothetical protein